jgi:hypothetical protein
VGRGFPAVLLVDVKHHRCRERTYLILLLTRNTVSPSFPRASGRKP